VETENRETDNNLISAFLRKERAFSFFQVVHLIETYYRARARVGYGGPASSESIRFRHEPSLEFPSSDIVAIKRDEDQPERFNLTTAFMGLCGTVSPLPAFYSEDILWSEQDEDTVKAFLDLFHHRLISLLYRSWSKYRYYIQFEPGGKDQISHRIFSLIGLGTEHLFDGLSVPHVRLLCYAGLLSHRPGSASGLKNILCNYLGDLPVNLRQCTGKWYSIHDEQRIKLGRENCSPGIDFTIGERVYGITGKFRIIIGPVGIFDFMNLLPENRGFKELTDIVGLYLTDRLDFEAELILRYEEVPGFVISSSEPRQLGWTTIFAPGHREDISLVIRG
jgi:type VI secretion system protein ImpH